MSIVDIALVPSVSPFRVAVPARLSRPTQRTFVRRRLAAAVALFAVAMVPALVLTTLATDRGGAPAPATAIRPSNASGAASSASYVVRPGDTMWSIANAHRGASTQGAYVETLIDANGGASLLVGQRIVLP